MKKSKSKMALMKEEAEETFQDKDWDRVLGNSNFEYLSQMIKEDFENDGIDNDIPQREPTKVKKRSNARHMSKMIRKDFEED